MDQSLRNTQRYTETHPESLVGWQRYARQLERQLEFPRIKGAKGVVTNSIRFFLKNALIETGLENIRQLSQIKTMPEIRDFVNYLFPFGYIEEFLDTRHYPNDGIINSSEFPHNPDHDVLLIKTGLHGYRDVPGELVEFFDGEGSFDLLEKDSEITWYAPFLSAWETPQHLRFVEDGGQFNSNNPDAALLNERIESWWQQKIRYRNGNRENGNP